MPGNRPNYLSVVISILLTTLLVACSDGDSPPPPESAQVVPQTNGNQLTLRVPPIIMKVCAPDILQLGLLVRINGESIAMTLPENGDNWTGILPVQEGATVNIELDWTHNGNVPLASLQAERTISSDQTIPLDEQDYTTADTDKDGFSNIAELCASPASDYNNIASVPTVQSTTSPVLSEITPGRLDLVANDLQVSSGSFRFSNVSSGESILDYTISSDQSFLSFSQTSGKLVAGEAQTITADGACSAGVNLFNATINVTTNGGDASIPVTLDCQPTGSNTNVAVLTNLTNQNMNLSAETNQSTSGTVSFTNSGDIPLEYLVTNNNIFFSVSPLGGSVPPGATETLAVTAQCGGQAEILNSFFSLTGNFSAASRINVTLNCGESLPSVFSTDYYPIALINIFGTINSRNLVGPFTAFVSLAAAIFENDPLPGLVTEVSRGEESVDSNGDPVYTAIFDCNAGGSINVDRQGRLFDAELINCQLGAFLLNGNLIDSGFVSSPRLFFTTYSDINVAIPGAKQIISGSLTYSSDLVESAFRYTDLQYTFDSESYNFTVSNGSTSATYNRGIYESEFEFDIVGSITNNRNLKVTSDNINKIRALEGFYYSEGSFTINAIDSDSEMKIEPGVNSPSTFQLSITENGTTTADPVPWSDDYYFPCGISVPTQEDNTFICREGE